MVILSPFASLSDPCILDIVFEVGVALGDRGVEGRIVGERGLCTIDENMIWAMRTGTSAICASQNRDIPQCACCEYEFVEVTNV